MDLLPPEIILGMVEQMDMATVMPFMQTTKACSPVPLSPLSPISPLSPLPAPCSLRP